MIALEVIGGYFLLAGIASAAALAVFVDWTGKLPPLLDGTPVGSALDDAARCQVDAWDADDAELDALDEHLSRYWRGLQRDRLAWERSTARAFYGGGWR